MRIELIRKRKEILSDIQEMLKGCNCYDSNASKGCKNCKALAKKGEQLNKLVEPRKKAKKLTNEILDAEVPELKGHHDHPGRTVWSEWKIEKIKQHHKNMYATELAEMLGVTKGQMDGKLARMGLKCKQRKGNEFEYYFHDRFMGKGTIKDLAKEFNVPYDTLYQASIKKQRKRRMVRIYE